MNFYKVSCYSKCGLYFASYLQSVTVLANDPEEAKVKVKRWLKCEGRNFIYEESKWNIELLKPEKYDVVDWFEDSDY